MFRPQEGSFTQNAELLSLLSPVFWIAFSFALLLSTPVFRVLREKAERSGRFSAYNSAAYAGSLVLFALSVLSLASDSYNPFIYFRF